MPSLANMVSRVGIPAELQRQLTGSHYEGGVTVTTSVQGLAELEAALNQLPEIVARKTLVGVMTEATEVFRARAQELAPYDPEKKEGMHLVDGIRKEMRVGSHNVAGAWVHGKVELHPDVFYGRFIEFGWTSARNGASIPAHPFMRPAFDDEKYRALAIVSQRLAAGIEAAARELHRQ
jgi:HK97 gp10 family phage protein